MYRPIACIVFLFATTTAWAQSAYDPSVAYTQLAGKTTYLYLANADGTHAVSVASSAKGFAGIDFAPGGNRIAFSDKSGLKVLTFTASNSGIVVNNVLLLVGGIYTSSPDFSSDGSRIIYNNYLTQNSVGGIYAVSAGGGTPAFLYEGYAGAPPRWLRPLSYGNAFAFLKHHLVGGANVSEIWVVLLDSNDNVMSAGPVLSTTSQAFNGIEDFDTARTRDALVMTADYATATGIVDFDLGSYTVTDRAGPGYRAHYSADDTKIVFHSSHQASGDYVDSLDLNSNGYVTRLTRKGDYGLIDTRP